jgi:lipoyl(octanoyl) transferase
MKNRVRLINAGLMDYKKAWDFQEEIFNAIISEKIAARNENRTLSETNHTLILCSHPHVYTLGKSGDAQNLLLDEQGLSDYQASYYKINRGGDITYHGPGQIVAYPILDLDFFFTDIHKYLRLLEEAIIMTLAHYGIEAGRYPGYTGVWIEPENDLRARKICAMGVRCSRWVTMHGLAFNVNTDLSYFGHIVPCGIKDKDVSSMQRELGHELNIKEVEEILVSKFAELFEVEIIST